MPLKKLRVSQAVPVAYLVPKMLPVVLAKVLGYQAPPCLAVFKHPVTNEVDVIEVPL